MLKANPNQSILSADDPDPLEAFNTKGGSRFFLICEHAGRLIPPSMGDMGLGNEDLRRHIAWDIGARDLAIELSNLLDAPLYTQRYSRLLCDCNRRPDVPSFTPARSEDTVVPANVDLTVEESAKRAAEIFWPFHRAISQALDSRAATGRRTYLVTIHTFTPIYLGRSRPWEIGVLFNRDRNFAPAIADWLKSNTDHVVGVNEPYAVGDDSDYAIPVHGEARGLPCVEFEVRNDLLFDEQSVSYWAKVIEQAIEAAGRRLSLPR